MGVPAGGAFDGESFALANALLRNPDGVACIELSMARLVLSATRPAAYAWTGAGASNSVGFIEPGQDLVLNPPERGCRSYLAIPGGVTFLGELTKGCEIEVDPGKDVQVRRLAAEPASLQEGALRVVKGPDSDRFDLAVFLTTLFTVSPALDRTGIRTKPVDGLRHSLELPSSPACMGAVQITPNGTALILGPDGPTIGGYPKIAVVAGADIPRLAQIRAGVSVSFQLIGFEEARRLQAEADAKLSRLVDQLRLPGSSHNR